MAVVFPKRLELSVLSHAHSALTPFELWSLMFPFLVSPRAVSMVLAGLLCFSLLSSRVYTFILEFFVAARS